MQVRTIEDSEPIIEEVREIGINFALLAKVADYVEVHPEEFDMDTWRKNSNEYRPWYARLIPAFDAGYTVGCVACHTVRLGAGNTSPVNTPAEAQRLLRISDEQALRLFYWHKWPQPYRTEYEGSHVRNVERAWIAAQRFRHFTATNGAE